MVEKEGKGKAGEGGGSVRQGRKTTSYFIQKPTGRRISFTVRAKTPEGTSPSIKHEIIDTINSSYQKQEIGFDSALTQLRNFIDTHLKEKKTPTLFNSENAEILSKYWEKFYTYKKISDKKSAYNRLRRAVECVGSLSLRSASGHQLQEAADLASDQRRVVSALSSLLKFIGRSDVILQKERKKRTKIAYLTLKEYNLTRAHLPDLCAMMGDVAFATGARQGEVFSIDRVIELADDRYSVWVEEQVKRSHKTDLTKNRRVRRAPVVSHFNQSVIQWADTPLAQKLEIRHLRFAELLQEAVTTAGINKKIVWHDLRHSYAIHLIGRGVSLSNVSQALGIGMSVCQEHYAGFELSDESMNAVALKL